jgi:hypothetical protein
MLDPCEWAKRCRALAKSATDPEVIEQLHVWAVEFADAAKEALQKPPIGPSRATRAEDAFGIRLSSPTAAICSAASCSDRPWAPP